MMEIAIREIAPRRAVCMEHVGPYPSIGAVFGKLNAWISETGAETFEGIGIFYDDPSVTPAEELRSDAGAFVPAGYSTNDPRVHVAEVPGGKYVVGLHIGPYEGLGGAWGAVCSWAAANGLKMAGKPSFEVYLNNCDLVPAEELRTEICLPVE